MLSAAAVLAIRTAVFGAALATGAVVGIIAVAGGTNNSGGGATGNAGADTAASDPRPARRVILLIGDGLGAPQRRLIRATTVGFGRRLSMDRLAYAGRVSTGNVNRATTDSAAAATAIATGVKTLNGAVGVDAKGRSVPSVFDFARRVGKSTGLVTTSDVTDATPAAFAASVRDRSEQGEIARQYLDETRPNVILGGGRAVWSPALVRRARGLNYDYVTSRRALAASSGRRILGLFADGPMFKSRREEEGGRYSPAVSLATMTRKALRTLSRNRRGFFLLVEEEAVDEMGHKNNASLVIKSGRALDRAVTVARSFARRNPGTLVLVTGDHETGGLTVKAADPDGTQDDGPFAVPGSRRRLEAEWRTTGHTGDKVPFTAGGASARHFANIGENTDLFRRMVRAARLSRP